MNLYTHRIHHDPARVTLKLDWLGSEAKPHFLCSVEVLQPKAPVPEYLTLFLLSGHHATECVQIVVRLGRALILEAASEGQEALMARLRALANTWNDPSPEVTAWEAPGAHAILGQVTSLEWEAMKRHRA